MELWKECLDRSWPVLREVARGYRRLVLRRTWVIVITGSYGKTTTQRAITVALGMEPTGWKEQLPERVAKVAPDLSVAAFRSV
jgi:UDP-N-acetylmuramoylalanine-D-glutamate ligase